VARLGSFAASVDLPEAMRPWSASGMEFLFAPGGITEPIPGEQATIVAATPVGATLAPTQITSTEAISPPAQSGAPLPRWPEPWRSLAGRIKGTPRVVIAYLDLALDLSGTPHPGRRKLFRDILTYASWPSGTALFWPLSSLKDGKPVFSPTIFVGGIQHFGIGTVLCFGKDTSDMAGGLLGEGRDHDLITIKSLPHPSELLNLLPHELHLALGDIKGLGLK